MNKNGDFFHPKEFLSCKRPAKDGEWRDIWCRLTLVTHCCLCVSSFKPDSVSLASMAGKNKIGVEEGDTPHEQEPDTKKIKGDGVEEPVNNGSGDCEASSGAVVETGGKPEEDVEKDVEEDVEEDDDAGRLLICGGTNWDLIGRKELPKSAAKQTPATAGKNLWGPHVWGEKIRVKEVISSCCAVHSVIITTDGKAMTWGRNDKGQLGHGDLVTRPAPTVVKGLEHLNIVSAACGKGHTLFLTDKGDVYACGENKMGQLGIGNQTATVMNPSKVCLVILHLTDLV